MEYSGGPLRECVKGKMPLHLVTKDYSWEQMVTLVPLIFVIVFDMKKCGYLSLG